MARRIDESRWTRNDDGSYTRRAPVVENEEKPEVPVVEEVVVEEEVVVDVEEEEDVSITKAARELAEQLGVDVSGIQGSGADGRITKGDVEAAADLEEVP